jgi:predicted ATP-grasp superfamily ATP-dependent carboligase
VSTYREAVDPSPPLVAQCEQLLAALDYNGPAMIEFKADGIAGGMVLMEINARLWGSLQLATDAGANFPGAMVALAFDLPMPSVQPKAGVRSFWEFGELDHALALVRQKRETLHLPSEVRVGLSAALRALLGRRLTDRPEVFRWRDPAPFLYEAFRWGRGL